MVNKLLISDINDNEKLAKLAELAKDDDSIFENMLKSFEKRNKAIAYKTVGHFVTDSDDEWSVVLLAFFEAVKNYDRSKGNFRSFSEMVIKRRLIDNIRREQGHSRELPYNMECDEEAVPIDAAASMQECREMDEQASTRLEIEALSSIISEYGIEFSDLVKASPKAVKTKKACAIAINAVIGDDDLLSYMRTKRELPLKLLTEREGIPRKILERHRKYIIATIEIIDGDFPILYEYVRAARNVATESTVTKIDI